MRLPSDKSLLSSLTQPEKQEAIIERRSAIRAHRDAQGDDRCWVDDYTVWKLLDDSPEDLTTAPSFEDGMKCCRDFFNFRQEDHQDSIEPVTDTAHWDDDLIAMTNDQLLDGLLQLQIAIRSHRDTTNQPRTMEDDKALYSVLPEKVATDFSLPPEVDFLGEAKAPHAGCPSFWRSHQNCSTTKHNLHRWGPCN